MKTKPTYTRRQFLHRTALTAGAFAAVPTITSAAAGRTNDADLRLPASLSSSKPPYLVFLPLADGISPAKVFQDREYIQTLPIDGVVMKGRTVVSGDETVPYPEKPDWVRAAANQVVISGVPPATPRTDTLVAVISAAGKSDTLRLTIVTSVPPIHAGDGTDK